MKDPKPQYPESPYLFHTYRRQPVTFVRGKGSWLWDDNGRRYLDFFSGLAVCGLGHADARVARAVSDQIRRLVHTSNIYFTEPQLKLGRELSKRTFGGKIFFCNSGAEANECAIKLARRFGERNPGPAGPRHEIIVFRNSFHGRTLATLAATAQEKMHKGFGPLPEGFPAADFGDLASAERALTDKTCAVLVEPVQGEGGVRTAEAAFFRGLRALCRRHDLLLMFDEIQTGTGRTGKLFAYQRLDVTPDVLTLAKGIANGLPLGAVAARAGVADLFEPGDHGSTFGGGPVVCRAALEVLKILSPKTLRRVQDLGAFFLKELTSWKEDIPAVRSVRGLGLMLGLELDRPCAPLVQACREGGLLVNCTSESVVRLLPPLTLSKEEARSGLKILKRALISLTLSVKT